VKRPLFLAVGATLFVAGAQAETRWRWSFQGAGIVASGAFTTRDAPNAEGFYEITGITGEANGIAITGLEPAGTSIPGNMGYPVDNLLKSGDLQLSKHGFGFALADGTYANLFYGAHFSPPGYCVFISDPASGKSREPFVTFTAVPAP